MTSFSIKAGAPGPWRSVQEMLRTDHNGDRAAILERIAHRTRGGVPLEDRLDWLGDMRAALAPLTSGATTREAARAALASAREVLVGSLRDPGEYVAKPALDDAEVRIRAMPRADVLQLEADLDKYPGREGAPTRERIACAFLARSLAGVRCTVEAGRLDVDEDEMADAAKAAEVVAVLEEAAIVPWIFTAVRAYQNLDPLPRRGFGLPHPSTSPTSTAATARALDGSSGAVEAPTDPRPSTSEGTSNSKPAGAPSDTSSTASPPAMATATTSSPTLPVEAATSDMRSISGSPSATSLPASTFPP